MSLENKLVSECLVFLLSKAYQKGHQIVQKRLKPYGITNVQYVVLEMLWEHAGMTAAELGTQLMIDKATMSGILERMVEADLLVKKQDSRDRRLFHLYPSDRINTFREKLIEERKSANEELMKDFSNRDRTELKRLLHDML